MDQDMDNNEEMRRFLITELGEDAYLNEHESSDEDDEYKLHIDLDNEDELFMMRSRRSKYKPSERKVNFTEIENDKDYDTDLEGLPNNNEFILVQNE